MASASPCSSSTASDTDTSPPLTPHMRIAFPSLAFASGNAMTIPLKSLPSPPSTTISASDFTTLSPSSSGSISPLSTISYASCAYPSWPKSDILSPTSSVASSPDFTPSPFGASYASGSAQASSYITDEDLLDLANLPLYNNIRIPPELLIAATPAQDVVVEKRRPRSQRVILPEAMQQLSMPVGRTESAVMLSAKRRRRSSPLKRRKLVLGLSPVVEGAE